MKTIFYVFFICLLLACNNQSKLDIISKQDSISNTSDKKVEHILQNDDSMIKLKEKELLEKYK